MSEKCCCCCKEFRARKDVTAAFKTRNRYFSVSAEIAKIRLQMARIGWHSEDKLTDTGWGDSFGYSIWFRRWDWHGGTRLIEAIGTDACYHAHRKGLGEEQMLDAVEEAAARARKAWALFPSPNLPPVQMADGVLKGR